MPRAVFGKRAHAIPDGSYIVAASVEEQCVGGQQVRIIVRNEQARGLGSGHLVSPHCILCEQQFGGPIESQRKFVPNVYAPNGERKASRHPDRSRVRGHGERRVSQYQECHTQGLARGASYSAVAHGIVPNNTGGFGAANTAADVFGRNEIEALRRRFAQLNDWIGDEVVDANPY
jgi:hypothetical protein